MTSLLKNPDEFKKLSKVENEGYKLIYAQRKLLKDGQHGPDGIMKKGDDVLIVEAKGSYCKKAEISDGNKRGRRLTAVLKKDKVKKLTISFKRLVECKCSKKVFK